MTDAPTTPEDNHLLAALPASAKERIFPRLRQIDVNLGDVIYESGQTMDFVYFPTNCIISLLYVMINGSSAEISVVGNEGVTGVAVFMGVRAPPAAPSFRAKALPTGCRPRT